MARKATAKFRRRTVDFRSGDSFCSAWLYLPHTVSEAPVPVVVMGHGLGATREMGLAPYAERFAAAGLAVLVFTYRHLGDSGGEPRQVLSMTKQLADWDAALEYAAGLPEVDRSRVAVWGSSLGGGHAIAVAARHPVASRRGRPVPLHRRAGFGGRARCAGILGAVRFRGPRPPGGGAGQGSRSAFPWRPHPAGRGS